MNLTVTLLGISVYQLVWEMLPNWGTWFDSVLKRLPAPLQSLYEQWRCAYCVGFWLALALHAVTGMWTIESLSNLPSFWGAVAPVVGWFLDALATATLIYVAKNLIDVTHQLTMNGLLRNT